ncbi:MAG: hypothetical protein V7695_20605 [Sulfitobacter sp.]
MTISNQRPEAGLSELKGFIETAQLDASALSNIDSATRAMYRKFYALLVFDDLLQEKLTDEDQRTYGKEAISDMSHGFFLTCIGLYKPARTSLRSSLENLVRFLLLHKGIDALSITSVYTLFDEAKLTFAGNASQKRRLGLLYSHYKELCKAVHSSSKDHMNLEVPFNTMLQFDAGKFAANRNMVKDCCTIAGEMLFIEFNEHVQSGHHSQRDVLSDSVARAVRREARERREIL